MVSWTISWFIEEKQQIISTTLYLFVWHLLLNLCVYFSQSDIADICCNHYVWYNGTYNIFFDMRCSDFDISCTILIKASAQSSVENPTFSRMLCTTEGIAHLAMRHLTPNTAIVFHYLWRLQDSALSHANNVCKEPLSPWERALW